MMTHNCLQSKRVRARNLPGMRLILIAIYATAFTIVTPVLYHLGLPVPIRYINVVGGALIFPITVTGVYIYAKSQRVQQFYKKSHLIKIKFWFCLLFLLAILGMFHDIPLDDIAREGIAFSYFGIFLLLGGDDRFFHVVMRHLLIIFYLGAPLILLFYDTPQIMLSYSGIIKNAVANVNYRFTNSIGYSLRPLIAPGLFIGIWGLVQYKNKIKQSLSIGVIVLFFVINAVLFQFRSLGLTILATVFLFMFYRPFLDHRLHLGKSTILLAIAFLGLGYYITTESFYQMTQRMVGNNYNIDLFDSRQSELYAYMDDLGAEILVGRGLGGSFDASKVYHHLSAQKWPTLHYGILVFTLKGGGIFFLAFVSFLLPGLIPRKVCWYHNPCNMVAALLFPKVLFTLTLAPISLSPSSLMSLMVMSLIFARFARRTELDSPRQNNTANIQ